MIRLLIADDKNLIRQALKVHFQWEGELEVVGTAENGQKALKLIADLNPDLVLMELEMPDLGGLTATKIITQRFPETKVLIMSSHEREDYRQQAITVGAQAYFVKSRPVEELSTAIKSIYQSQGKSRARISREELKEVGSDGWFCSHQAKLRFSLTIAPLARSLRWFHRWRKKRGIVLLSLLGVAMFLAIVFQF